MPPKRRGGPTGPKTGKLQKIYAASSPRSSTSTATSRQHDPWARPSIAYTNGHTRERTAFSPDDSIHIAPRPLQDGSPRGTAASVRPGRYVSPYAVGDGQPQVENTSPEETRHTGGQGMKKARDDEGDGGGPMATSEAEDAGVVHGVSVLLMGIARGQESPSEAMQAGSLIGTKTTEGNGGSVSIAVQTPDVSNEAPDDGHGQPVSRSANLNVGRSSREPRQPSVNPPDRMILHFGHQVARHGTYKGALKAVEERLSTHISHQESLGKEILEDEAAASNDKAAAETLERRIDQLQSELTELQRRIAERGKALGNKARLLQETVRARKEAESEVKATKDLMKEIRKELGFDSSDEADRSSIATRQ
ncbi:hypothetical protein LTR50_005684 [Elasticomyces elasticus]|nr:hypothetical protein LTR50_005684 [Elasticomyces elasticus]